MAVLKSSSRSNAHLHLLSDVVLERGTARVRAALGHLGDHAGDHAGDARSEPVRRLQRSLRAMEHEQTRRGQQKGARPQKATRGSNAHPGNGQHRPHGKRAAPRQKAASEDSGDGPRDSSAPSRPGGGGYALANACRAVPGAPERHAAERHAAERHAAEPIWRLIPSLRGASSKVVSVLDGAGVVCYQSAPVKWLLGFDAEVLVGRPLAAFLRAPYRERARKGIDRMARGEGIVDSWRFPFCTASGESFWLEGVAANFLRDSRLGGILVYWRECAGAAAGQQR